MSLAVVDHEAAALARLPEYLKSKPKLASLLAAFTAQCDDLEAALQDLLLDRAIDTGVGAQLDDIGTIVGQPRDGLSDAEYRRRLRIRIAVNRSRGTVADILKVASLFVTDASATFVLTSGGVAAYTLYVGGIETGDFAEQLLTFLKSATAAGVRAILNYSVGDPVNSLVWGSSDPNQLWGAAWSGSID